VQDVEQDRSFIGLGSRQREAHGQAVQGGQHVQT